ncbi:MAG: serine hydrolase [Acidobacteria bacterium]|nr:serine hydrolase [Acidobacteriota bacterium]MBV9476780.1 serine hydrolase [Acidobacteriota bacterium]
MRPLRAFVVVCVFAAGAFAQQQRLDAKTLDRAVTNTMRAWKIPGAAIAIVQNDRVIYANGYGVKDFTTNALVTSDTLFQIASTSKAFTTAALAMLVDEKKLSWDDPVREHLEYFRLADECASSQVTIRDLVTHRTGLSRHDELWDNTPLTREDVVRRIGFVPLSKPFRTEYQYQNIMFIAAGEVVTHASGMRWDDFVKTRIFQPLQMTRTVTSDADWAASDHANGFRYDFTTERVTPQQPIDTTTIGAGGAIKSSAHDMANWIRFQLAQGFFDNRQLVSAEGLGETKTPQTVIRLDGLTRDTNPETQLLSYAMGWNVQDYRGELLVSHAGALNGFRTHVDLLPRRNIGFVILSNLGRGMALVALRNTLIDMLTAKMGRDWNAYYLMVDRKADEKEAKEKLDRQARRQPNTTPSHPLAAYAGDYESRAYGTVKISLAENGLVLRWNRLTIPLAHFHYDVFTAVSEPDDVDEQVAFSSDVDGTVKTLTFFDETFTRR